MRSIVARGSGRRRGFTRSISGVGPGYSPDVPWTLRVDPRNRVSYISFTGLITFSDLAAAQVALAADPTFDPAFPLLIDLRCATEIVLTRDDMHALVTLAGVA